MEEQNVTQDTSVCRHSQTRYCKSGRQCDKTHNRICLPAQTDTPGHVNMLQIMAIADTKISVPMYTLVKKPMKN